MAGRPLPGPYAFQPVQRMAGGRASERPDVQATIPMNRVEAFLRGARRRGVDADALMARQGIPPAAPGAGLARVPIAQFAQLLRQLCHRLRDEFLGCCSRPVKPGTLALAATEMRRGATLEQALRTGLGIYRLAIDDFVAHLHVRDGMARIVLVDRNALPQGRFVHCAFLHSAWGLACWLVQQRIPIHGAALGYAAPPEPHREARHLFGIALQCGQRHSSIAFDARWLAQPVVADEAQLRELLQRVPEVLLLRFRDQGSLGVKVRQCLLRQMSGGLPSLEQTAWNLKMTPHALRRRLAGQGTSFQDIKNALRRDAAIDLLTQTTLGLDQVAQRLAFSETSTFHRSFKQWTGATPGAYRRAHRAAAEGGGRPA